MLEWASNRNAHMKFQVRYLMERLVKRFGVDKMMTVTPEPHQRLLTHMRKTKERERRHVERRLAEKDARAQRGWDEGGSGSSRRHDEYESLLEAGADKAADDEGGAADSEEVDLLTAPLMGALAAGHLGGKRRRGVGGGGETCGFRVGLPFPSSITSPGPFFL